MIELHIFAQSASVNRPEPWSTARRVHAYRTREWSCSRRPGHPATSWGSDVAISRYQAVQLTGGTERSRPVGASVVIYRHALWSGLRQPKSIPILRSYD